MFRFAVSVLILLCYDVLLFADGVQCTQCLSKEENDDMEIKLKLLNKPPIKTIQDKYGEIYDCVDVYKQLALDHPLLKNHNVDFSTISSAPYYNASRQDYSINGKSLFKNILNVTMCPVGTIPVRRLNKEDLIRESQATTARTNRANTFLAVARTKPGRSKYSGGQCSIKLDNPKASGQQYTATRIKLQAGQDSIEAGWRVDPSLYGDSKTRFFIRTDAGKTHCFDIRCPGFIQTSKDIILGGPVEGISVPGQSGYLYHYNIVRNGNWNLVMGKHAVMIGYWPSQIFTGLSGLADLVEWGGAAYSPPGKPLPPMGSGNHPIMSVDWDGFVRKIQVQNESGQVIDACDIKIYEDDPRLYSVLDGGYPNKVWGRVIFYGGPGHI